MARDELPYAFRIATIHTGGDIDETVMLEIAAVMMETLDGFILRRDRTQIDHGEIAALGEVARFIENIGNAARHAGGKIASGIADHQYAAAGHVFAAMIADALDDSNCSGIAHRKALAGNAAEITFAADSAVKHRITDD